MARDRVALKRVAPYAKCGLTLHHDTYVNVIYIR